MGYRTTYNMTMIMHHPIFYTQKRGMAANRDSIAVIKKNIMKEITKVQNKLDVQIRKKFPSRTLRNVHTETGEEGLLNVYSPIRPVKFSYL